jgi:hypothetical protein
MALRCSLSCVVDGGSVDGGSVDLGSIDLGSIDLGSVDPVNRGWIVG